MNTRFSNGIIIDVETTGLDPTTAEIIEIGIVSFEYSNGIASVTSLYGELQEPTSPISDEISAITGLTNTILKGKRINWPLVNELMAKAQFAVAHNVDYDRTILERDSRVVSSPEFWSCSVNHIDWAAKGSKSRKLNHLAADMGFLNPFPHRALFDGMTTFKVIAPHMEELLSRLGKREFVIQVSGKAYDIREQLKSRGFSWVPDTKTWEKTFIEDLSPDLHAFIESIRSKEVRAEISEVPQR